MALKRIVMFGLLAAATLPIPAAFAQSASQRVPVTSAMVVAALQADHLPVEGVSVKIAAPITAAVARPTLQVQSISTATLHSAQIRLVCVNHADCLPFFAEVTWPDQIDVISLAAKANRIQKESPRSTTGTSATADKGSFVMTVGTDALLLIEDDRVHVSIRVIALENGSAGDLIHVATPDHRQRYVASIIDSSVLKGHF